MAARPDLLWSLRKVDGELPRIMQSLRSNATPTTTNSSQFRHLDLTQRPRLPGVIRRTDAFGDHAFQLQLACAPVVRPVTAFKLAVLNGLRRGLLAQHSREVFLSLQEGRASEVLPIDMEQVKADVRSPFPWSSAAWVELKAARRSSQTRRSLDRHA